ncbi:hypothetical protein GCM10027605_54890 [Micromonospora zhanjiangensis]
MFTGTVFGARNDKLPAVDLLLVVGGQPDAAAPTAAPLGPVRRRVSSLGSGYRAAGPLTSEEMSHAYPASHHVLDSLAA